MHRPRADAHKPGLGIWVTRQEAVGSREDVFCHFVGARFNIDRHDLAVIAGFDLRTDLALIELVATTCELFFAVPWLSHGHRSTPVQLGTRGHIVCMSTALLYHVWWANHLGQTDGIL